VGANNTAKKENSGIGPRLNLRRTIQKTNKAHTKSATIGGSLTAYTVDKCGKILDTTYKQYK
jgi:hypothetical protein